MAEKMSVHSRATRIVEQFPGVRHLYSFVKYEIELAEKAAYAEGFKAGQAEMQERIRIMLCARSDAAGSRIVVSTLENAIQALSALPIEDKP